MKRFLASSFSLKTTGGISLEGEAEPTPDFAEKLQADPFYYHNALYWQHFFYKFFFARVITILTKILQSGTACGKGKKLLQQDTKLFN